MLEIREWIRTCSLPRRPWLILGKGPSFTHHRRVDLSQFNLLSLNHAVRELKVDVAHIIDADVVKDCEASLLRNCRWLIIPRRPHVRCAPGPSLEDLVQQSPALRELDAQGRLVWYNLSSSPPQGDSPVIRARYFSAEAALRLLALTGARQVRTLGVDGGRGYSPAFKDLEQTTLLANGQPSFDLQQAELQRIVREALIDFAPLVEPLRIFVGTDDSQMVAARVLEHSLRKHATRHVEFVPMNGLTTPVPRNARNRPRTGFSFHRFLIPKLCGFRGRALYLDADMQVFADAAELCDIPFGRQKVLCTFQERRPGAWEHDQHFQPGRQLSVMLLDCSRLDWDIDDIVRGLDRGRYDYRRLMFDLCLVPPEEIGDRIPPAWNCLEWFDAQTTKLLHYTVVPTQPWKNGANPLCAIWEAAFREALEAGALPPELVTQSVRAGFVKPSLADSLPEQSAVRRRIDRVQHRLRLFSRTWGGRLKRVAADPGLLFRRTRNGNKT